MKKRIYRIIKYLFIILFVLMVTLVLLSQIKSVQNAVAQKTIQWFSQKTGTEVVLQEFRWRKFKKLEIKDFHLLDLEGDTLAAIGHGVLEFKPFSLFHRKVILTNLVLTDASVNLKADQTGALNFQYILDAFPSGDTVSTPGTWMINPLKVNLNRIRFGYFDKKTGTQLTSKIDSLTTVFKDLNLENKQIDVDQLVLKQPELHYLFYALPDAVVKPTAPDNSINFPDLGWEILVKTFEVHSGVIQYREKSNTKTVSGFNVQNIAIEDLELDVGQIEVGPKAMSANLKSLTLRDHSGLTVNHLSSQIRFTDNMAELDQFELQTIDSQVKQSLKLTYADFNSLINFSNQNNTTASPQVKWKITDSHIDPKDINLVLPGALPAENNKPIAIDADLEGSTDQLLIKNLDINQDGNLRLKGSGQVNHLWNTDLLHFDLAIHNSKADYQKLRSFLPAGTLPPALKQWGSMELTGLLKGRLSDCQLNTITLKTDSGPQVNFSSRIKGLPEYKTALFELQLNNLRTHPDHWKGFITESLPAFVDSLGRMTLKGNYTGSLTNFRTNLLLTSETGQLHTEANFIFEPDYSDGSYSGNLTLKQFDLGMMTGDTLLGTVNLQADIDGKGIQPEDWDTRISAIISDLAYKDYSYDSLHLDGRLKSSVFDGLVVLKDPNITFEYEGLISLEDTIPAYHFTLKVDTIDFKALGLSRETLGLSTRMELNCTNADVDQLEGDLVIDHLSIRNADTYYQTDSIRISSHLDTLQGRQLLGQSDLLSFGISGNYELSQLPQIWTIWLDQYFFSSKLFFSETSEKNIPGADTLAAPPTNITAFVHLDDPTELTSIFLPQLKKIDALDVTLQFDNQRDIWNIHGQVANLEYEDFKINDIQLNSMANAKVLQTILMADSLQGGPNRMLLQPGLALALQNDSLFIKVSSSVPDSVFSAIGGNITQETGTLTFHFDEQIMIGGENWAIDENNQITYAKNQEWSIRHLNLNKQKEHIYIDGQGNIADSTSQANVSFDNFDLNYLGMLLGYPDGHVGGILNGEATLSDIQTNLHYKADLDLREWTFDTVLIGNLNLKATQLIHRPLIKMEASLGGAGSTIRASGQYDIDQRQFDAIAEVEKLEMRVLDPFVEGLIHDSEGYLNGQFNLRGSPERPILNGTLSLNKLKTVIDYVNTTYNIDSGTILLNEKEIDFGTIQMTDITNRINAPTVNDHRPKATLSGKVKHQFFDEINMDLRFKTDRFQFLNTTAKDNELFYGSLLLKTDIFITGPVANPAFNINARTEPGTRFFVVPLTEEQVISREDFIVFGKPELDSLGRDTSYLKNYKITAPGIDLQLNLELTPDAELQVIIDPVTGDKLICSGRSAITLEMDRAGNVSLIGDYNITSGKYTFNYEQLLKREFNITEGSNIVFNGDPLQAKLDLTATYETRVNLTDLVPDYTSTLNQRANVQVQMNIKGDLIKPVLTFDIRLPGNVQGSLAEAAKVRLEQIRNNETELNTQVFGLLLFNSFLSSANNNGSVSNAGEAVLLSSVSKLITNQLNNFANKLIKGVDLTLGVDAYKPTEEGALNEGVTTEVQLGVSKRVFNDRLAIKVGGNLNVGASRENEEVLTAFTSDFALEYSLTPSGNYVLRVYRQSDYDAVNEGNVTRTGAGISIKKKFKNKQRKRKK